MERFKLHIFLLITSVCLAVSCKKKNETVPTINILSISQNERFDFGDTLVVKFKITDRDGPVLVTVVDGEQNTGLSSELYTSSGNHYTYRVFINDRYMLSGTYHLKVTAFNGENRNSAFEKVWINELPKYIRGLSFLAKDNSQTTLYKLDSIGQLTSSGLPPYQYQVVESNSRNGQFTVIPETTGSIETYDFGTLMLDNSQTINPLFGVEYENFYLQGNDNYLFLKDKRIMRLGNGGSSPSLRLMLPNGFAPEVAAFSEDNILIGATRNLGNKLHELFLIRRENDFILRQSPIPEKAEAIDYAGNNIYFFIFKRDTHTIVAEFNSSTLAVTERFTINYTEPRDIKVTPSLVYVSTTHNTYTFNPNGLGQLNHLFTFGANTFQYDDVNNEIYYSNNTNIFKSAIGSSQNQYVAASPVYISDFTIVYNK